MSKHHDQHHGQHNEPSKSSAADTAPNGTTPIETTLDDASQKNDASASSGQNDTTQTETSSIDKKHCGDKQKCKKSGRFLENAGQKFDDCSHSFANKSRVFRVLSLIGFALVIGFLAKSCGGGHHGGGHHGNKGGYHQMQHGGDRGEMNGQQGYAPRGPNGGQ